MWDLSFLTRDRICVPCIERQIFNHWTTREVPTVHFLMRESLACRQGQGAVGWWKHSSDVNVEIQIICKCWLITAICFSLLLCFSSGLLFVYHVMCGIQNFTYNFKEIETLNPQTHPRVFWRSLKPVFNKHKDSWTIIFYQFLSLSFFLKKYKTIYWPLLTSIYNKLNNIQLNNILITTKLLFFLSSAELVTQNTEKIEPSCKEWIGVKSEKTSRSSID